MRIFVISILVFSCSALRAQYSDSLVKKKGVVGLKPIALQENFYTQHMGFMCKKELQLQKTVKLPVYIRLGSLDYTNYLEGKKRF